MVNTLFDLGSESYFRPINKLMLGQGFSGRYRKASMDIVEIYCLLCRKSGIALSVRALKPGRGLSCLAGKSCHRKNSPEVFRRFNSPGISTKENYRQLRNPFFRFIVIFIYELCLLKGVLSLIWFLIWFLLLFLHFLAPFMVSSTFPEYRGQVCTTGKVLWAWSRKKNCTSELFGCI